MTVIYIDILLALNLFIDYLLLAATARVLQLPLKRSRHLAASLLGAVSSLLILLPTMPAVLTVTSRLAVAAAMVAVAFWERRWRFLMRQTAVRFIISALFAGVCYAGQLWVSPTGMTVQNGIVYYNVPPMLLISLTVGSYLLLCLFERLTRKRLAEQCRFRIDILDGGELITLNAMFDSGHSLCDRFTGAPVILAKEQAVRSLNERYALTTTHKPRGPIRYIPYHCVAGDGVLMAFRPARVTLYADHRTVDISGVWIAVTTALIREEYDALIGPAVADRLSQTPAAERSFAL